MSATARIRSPVALPGSAATYAGALLAAATELAAAHTVEGVAEVVRRHARALSGADGVTFVLREGDQVHYLDEDAIAPLWRGSRFPAEACISGWSMIHRTPVVIEDIDEDDRIPHDLYRSTFVRALAMVPVRPEDPVAAIGAYWARNHRATPDEIAAIEALAGLASVALANVALLAELRDALRARDEFLHVAAHELRTPMSPLKIHLQSALRRIAQGRPEEGQAALERAGASLKRLETLVEDLLDASRIAEHELRLSREDSDLVALAREVVSSVAEGHPPVAVRAEGPVRAAVDRRRLAQVVECLLSNALRFGAGRPVEIRVETSADEARIAVRDQGAGIAPEDQARIFERFERASSLSHFGGLGLGLWLVREIAEAHGGRVEVASAPGEGSTFSVVLPASPAAR